MKCDQDQCKKGKKFRRLGVLGVLGGVFMAAALSLTGCSKWHSPEKKSRWVVKHLSSKLDLTEEQTAKLNDIRDEYLEARQRHKGKKKQMLSEVESLVVQDRLEETAIRKLMNEKQGVVDAEFPNFFPKVQDFHASLSPDQKKKAAELIAQYRERKCNH